MLSKTPMDASKPLRQALLMAKTTYEAEAHCFHPYLCAGGMPYATEHSQGRQGISPFQPLKGSDELYILHVHQREAGAYGPERVH